jgi:polysaccharide biosynthesis transport protein
MNEHLPAERPRSEAESPLSLSPRYGGQPPEIGGEDVIELRVLLQTLRRNVWLIALVTALASGAAVWMAYSAEPRYRASASLRLLDERRMLTGGMEMGVAEAMMGRQADPLLSQMQVLRSRAVLGEVVDREGLRLAVLDAAVPRSLLADLEITAAARPDTLRVGFAEDTYTVSSAAGAATATYGQPVSLAGVSFAVQARPDTRDAVLVIQDRDQSIDDLMQQLRARPRDRTDVVDIEFESRDRELAQRVVNTTAQVFRQRSQQAAGEQSRRRREFVEARLVETEALLRGAQEALSAFQRREQVFSSHELFAAQQVSMHSLELRREELDAERRMFVSMRDALAQGREGQREGLRTAVSAPGIAQNPVVSQLYTQLVRYEIARDSLRAGGSSATNPDWVRINALIESTEDNLAAALHNHVNALDARIAALDHLRRRRSAEITNMPSLQAEEARLTLDFETIRRMADQLREEAQRARISEVVEAGQVEIIDLAPLPGAPINDRKPLKLALGVMLGLIMGSGAAFLRENLNTQIARKDELESVLGLAGLAVIPRISENGGRPSRLPLRRAIRPATGTAVDRPLSELVTIGTERHAGAEAYRSLRTNLIFSQAHQAVRSLMVTSSMASEGKTTTAGNLAVTYAQQGLRVVLVDADLRKARLHRLFDVAREPGLVDVIAGMAQLDEVIRPTPVPGLSILSAGMLPPNPSELLGGERMRAILKHLEEQYDLVIIDAPPVLVAGDASIIGTMAGGAIVVVRAGQTDREAAAAAVKQLRRVGTRILGGVLNDPDGKVRAYEGYYYYAYSYYGETGKD